MPINSFENYPMSWHPQLKSQLGALYKILAAQLEEDIHNGSLKPGTKLPPQRELADFLDINLSTVTKTYKLCRLKGLLQASIGRGTYVAYDAMNSRLLWPDKWDDPEIISLGATRPDRHAYPIIRKHLQTLLAEDNSLTWFDYGTTEDMAWHRRAGARFIAREGFPISAENVFLTNGAQNALMATLLSLCSHGDAVGADPLTYPGLKSAAAALGIRLIPLSYTPDDQPDTQLLTNICQQNPLKAIYLMPQNQNPTTHTMTLTAKQSLAAFARSHGIAIIEDASYNLLSSKAEIPLAALLPEQTFFIAGLSKIIAPGLRLSYLAVPKTWHTAITNALYTMSITVSPLMSELSARLIVSGAAQKILTLHQEEARRRNKLADKHLKKFLIPADKTSIFRWLKLPPAFSSGAAFEKLALQHGVQVYAAERFALGDATPEKAIRLSITAPATSAILKKGLLILRKLLLSPPVPPGKTL